MSHIICDDPSCFNNNEGKLQFCTSCLEEIADKLSNEELYEMYLSCETKLKEMVKESDERETTERLAEAKLCRERLFDTINNLMLMKDGR